MIPQVLALMALQKMMPNNQPPGPTGGLPFRGPGLPLAGAANNSSMLHALGAPNMGGTLSGSPPNMAGSSGMSRLPTGMGSNITPSPVATIVREHFARQRPKVARGGFGAQTTLGM